jgi:membrane protein required for colicin V production
MTDCCIRDIERLPARPHISNDADRTTHMPASLPVSILDLVVIGVVLVSALLAAVRGFTREVLAIVAWVTAAAVAWFLHPLLLPQLKNHISNPTLALAAAIGAIFVVTLLIVSIITVKFSDFVLDSRIGALDRTLGFVFGAARGFLICVIGWVFLAWLVQGKMPEWASTARSRPMLEGTGNSLIGMLPDPEGVMAQVRKRQNEDVAQPPADTTPPRVTPPSPSRS